MDPDPENWNHGFSYYFYLMVEGSGPLTNGSRSGRPKNMWIRWIRIRNTGGKVTSSCCAVDAAYEAAQALTGSFLGDHQINLQLEENIPQVISVVSSNSNGRQKCYRYRQLIGNYGGWLRRACTLRNKYMERYQSSAGGRYSPGKVVSSYSNDRRPVEMRNVDEIWPSFG